MHEVVGAAVGPGQEIAVEASSLTKSYRKGLFRRRVPALDSLSLTIPTGSVSGLIGPNGSGKSTFVRCLLGLTKPDEGSAAIFGNDVVRSLPDVIHRVGVAFEEQVTFPGFTAVRNLEILAQILGQPRSLAIGALEMVGLRDWAKDQVSTFSMGMKQRLALAASIMKSPDLLILDEPTNGLDPESIVSLRNLIKQLNQRGITILLATHLLAEAEELCDYIAMILSGSCVAAGPLDSFLARGARTVYLQARDRSRALHVLGKEGITAKPHDAYLSVGDGTVSERVSEVLLKEGIVVTALWEDGPTLESVFMEIVGDARAR